VRAALRRHASARLLKRQPDHVLVELAQAGHEAAFEAIVVRYGRHMLAVARAVGPSQRAEDVVQQALLQAWRAFRGHEDVVDLLPWLRRIVHNASVDLSRRTRPRPDALREEQLLGEGVESVVERKHQLAKLVRALGDLPDRQREAIVMRELEGRPFDEIASEFGTSHGAVRQLVRRARAQLRTGVAALVPPALLARMLAYSAPQADGIGMSAKLGTAVAVGGSALAVGTFAPSLDQPARQPPVQQPAARGHAAQADRANPAKRTPRPGELSTRRPAPSDIRSLAAPTVASEQRGNHDGGNGQAAAADVGPRDAQSQSGEAKGESHDRQDEQVQQGGGSQG
jgi:RNA polymerase sigma factor (sigma-70 family)